MLYRLQNVTALDLAYDMQDKGTRIRQGSPEEEKALGTHLLSLMPTPRHLTEAGQLAELLILLGKMLPDFAL